jgi:outer membrane protein OmpU
MNKLTKIGASALCGSLAAISAANAGDLTVTGGADMTWMSQEGANTCNPLGIGSNMSFSGSGELDNGWNVKLAIYHTNANAYSNTHVLVGVPGLGDVKINQGGTGTGIQRLDDITPTVWEEADGAGLSAGIQKVNGTSAGATIELTPSSDLVPSGLTVRAAWSPDSDSEPGGDKSVSGSTGGTLGSGWDLTLEATDELHGIAGLTLYGGMSQVDQFQNAAAYSGDAEEEVLGIKYAAGSFTVGYQVSDDETGRASTNTKYENTSYGITFNVNDDLSIGYTHIESDVSTTTNVTAEADSIQAAYTMGGATIRIAEVDVENQAYSTAAGTDVEATIISLGLAF